jgi:hypothetical protein
MMKQARRRSKPNGINYSCIEEYVLKHGRDMDVAPLPSNVKRGKMKNCYKNAYDLALGSKRYIYCEGYAVGIIPVLHAWCFDTKTGKVVDPTWKDGKEYYGVKIDFTSVLRVVVERECYGVLDAWEIKHPALQDKLKLIA